MRSLRVILSIVALSACARAAKPKLDPDKLLAEAQNDYVDGDFAKAIEKARRVLKARDAAAVTRAWRIIGSASCNVHDRDGAVQAWNRLDASGRQYVAYVCKRNGIELP
jgi:hypothetical protein